MIPTTYDVYITRNNGEVFRATIEGVEYPILDKRTAEVAALNFSKSDEILMAFVMKTQVCISFKGKGTPNFRKGVPGKEVGNGNGSVGVDGDGDAPAGDGAGPDVFRPTPQAR